MSGQSRPAYIEAGGVFLPGSVCEVLWQFVQNELRRHRSDGGQIRPELQEAVLVLRRAAQAHLLQQREMSANGHANGPAADLGPVWDQVWTTEQAATRIGCSPRHLRRLAAAEGVIPAGHNQWTGEQIESLATRRR